MQINVMVAQFPIGLAPAGNLAAMLALLALAQPGDLVLFPEGALSGYARDLSFLSAIRLGELNDGMQRLNAEARERGIHLWYGTLYPEGERWFNLAVGCTPEGERHIYRKVNLANNERGVLAPGDQLPLFRLRFAQGQVTVAAQVCRELRYPEQWGWLARQGAQVFLHPNNATGYPEAIPVWRSHLVSRAAESQRYVLSANAAAGAQNCPTLVIAPNGVIINEIIAAGASVTRATLDLDAVANTHIDQCRTDLVQITTVKPSAAVSPGAHSTQEL